MGQIKRRLKKSEVQSLPSMDESEEHHNRDHSSAFFVCDDCQPSENNEILYR